MDSRTTVFVVIGVLAAVFVCISFYWWEVRPVRRSKLEDRLPSTNDSSR
jgi:hypothetical protein